jgi:hypothetical protein
MNEWITVNESLNILHITSRTTLYKFLTKHHIRVTKPLGRLYINRKDIEDVMNQLSVKIGV